MSIDIVRQAMTELPAIAADAILPPPAFQMLQPQRIHRLGIPDALHGLGAHVTDHQLAAPVEEARTDQSIRVNGIAVKDIRTNICVADILLVDTFAYFNASVFFDIELGPAGCEIFDEDPVTMIAESVEEFLTLRIRDQLSRNLDHNLAIALVGVNPFDVFNEFAEVEFETGKAQIGLFRHALDRNVDLVDAGFQHGANTIRGQECAVGGRVDIVDAP